MTAQRYKPYPTYKDSGVAWLGEIPGHWEVRMLKRFSVMRAGVAITAQSIQPTGEFPVYGGNGVRGFTKEHTHEGQFPLIGRQGALCGCVNFATGKFWASEHAVVARSREGVDPRWLTALLQSMALNRYSQSAAQPGLAVETIEVIHAPRPPESEQKAIAAFLDRETAQINALLAKKERLIELLQEERTALITRAVTKGLDPNVPMKDSGVEWLGEIPAHWEAKRMKQALSAPLQYGANEAAELDDPDLPRFIRITDIGGNDTLREDTFKSLPADIAEEYLLRDGDLLLARSGATAGKSFLYRRSWGECAYAGYLIRARLDIDVALPEFVRYFTASSSYWQWLSGTFIQATIQNVSAERYASLRIPLPPVREQRAIAAYLDQETARIDALVAKVREAIERLKELRTALIAAAVTGKIDVREEVA